MSPRPTDGFGFFFGSLGAAFALGAGPPGFRQVLEYTGDILDSLFLLENHLIFSLSFDASSDDVPNILICLLGISFVEAVVCMRVISHQIGIPYLPPS